MKLEDYNQYCASLHATTKVVQWGGAHVWKIGGKVFAIAGWSDEPEPHIVFKCSDLSFDILKHHDGLRPAPYLAARGGKWIQMFQSGALDDETAFDYLHESYRLISRKLTKKLRAELGLDQYL